MKINIMLVLGLALIAVFLLYKKVAAGPKKQNDKDKNTKKNNPGKSVGLIIASKDFQPAEYSETKKQLKSYNVVTISDKPGEAVSAGNQLTVKPDCTINEIDANDFIGLFLIGGPGTVAAFGKDSSNFETIESLFTTMKKSEKPYGGICIAPKVLAQAGVLDGAKATCWQNSTNPIEPIFSKYNVISAVSQDVVVDGFVVTANGPGSASDFGKKIVDVIENYLSQKRGSSSN